MLSKSALIVSALLLIALGSALAQGTAPSAADSGARRSVLKAGEGMDVRVPLDTGAVINGSYPIDSAGFVILPILGAYYVHDQSVQDVQTYLGQKLSSYLRDTHIMVTPVIRLTLLGHWQHPGMHYVNSEMSVWDACRIVGGPAGEQNFYKWKIMRGDQEVPVSLLNEFAKGTTLRKAGIRSGDIFVIPVPDPQSGFWYWFRETLTVTAQIATIGTTALTAYLTWYAIDHNTR